METMKEQSNEPLLFDAEDTPFVNWKDRQVSSSLWRGKTTLLSILIKLLTSLCSGVILLLVLGLICPQLLLSLVQTISESQSEYAYKHFPLRSEVQWMKLPGDPDYWSNKLYMGEASPESDLAWNKLMKRHGFRAYQKEAERLNLTSSLPLENGGFSASLGVDHNLHCLRHFKQWYYRDYYYANKTDEDIAWLEGHTLHCLETLRKSVMCFPDLNLSPYYTVPDQPHHPTHISTWGVKQCVDYDVLNEALDDRRYPHSEYGKEVNGLFEAANRD